MPNEPSKQHYVPKMYLNNFCSQVNGQKMLYGFKRSKIHLPIPEKLQYYAPSSICKIEDLYTINDRAMMHDFSINDEYDVEKRAFRIYENNYNKILERVGELYFANGSDSL